MAHHTRGERQKPTTDTYRYNYQRIFGRKKDEPREPKPPKNYEYKEAKRGA